jgi:xanthine dehydrogenase accessory factor
MTDSGQLDSMDVEIYRRLAEMVAQGRTGVLATVIATRLSAPRRAGSKMIIHPDGTLTGSVGGGAAEARVIAAAVEVLADGVCRRLDLDLAGDVGVCGGSMEVFLEPVLRTVPFVVIGAGHVGRAVVAVGRHLPFRFTLVDDRPEWLAGPETPVGVGLVESDPAGLAERIEVAPHGGVLIVSRNHELDGDYLEALLEMERASGREFGFLGALGSRAKAAKIRKRLADRTEFAERCTRLQLPVGLDLGAESPAEIGLSVLAEAMAVLRGVTLLEDDKGRPVGVRLQRRRDS